MTITMTDIFAGAGGSSTGGATVPGVEVKIAANHWQLAVQVHNENHPDTDHACVDLHLEDPRNFPKTDLLWAPNGPSQTAKPQSGAMGSHQSTRAGTTTWLTPPHILEALGPFDLDPCGHPGWATAERIICLPKDGLAAAWAGRVWLNPPYSHEAWAWLGKLADHGYGTALVFARTETAGFTRQVWGRADAVLFLHGRLHFHRPSGERAKANAGAPSVLVAYGPEDANRLRRCSLAGTFVPGWRSAGAA